MDKHIGGYGALDPSRLENFVNPLRLPGESGLFAVFEGAPAAEPASLTVGWEEVEVLPGRRTRMLAYRAERDGRVLLDPIFVAEEGTTFAADLSNGLAEETTIHWHGLDLDWRQDGHPSRPVASGATRRYEFPVQNRGGSHWYHPHPHGSTARQTYLGLAGMFLVRDEDERRLEEALGLTLGETDIPLVLQDKSFAEDGSLLYEPDEAALEMGVEGDVVLVNLTPTPFLEVNARPYRFRVLNASNARTFRLALSRTPAETAAAGDAGEEERLAYLVLATDGNRLGKPRSATEVFLAPGERVDLLIDLGGLEAGEEAVLKSLPFDPMHNEHELDGAGHHMHMGPERLPDGSGFYLFRLRVSKSSGHRGAVPEPLAESAPSPPLELDGAKVRSLTLSLEKDADGRSRWLIGGESYEPEGYSIVVRGGETELWEIINEERSMPHPMHLHGFRFMVLERRGSPEQVADLAVDGSGRTVTDLGWKDTVLVWPGETVRIAMRFSHGFEGDQRYLFHCHILEHEDSGMMINYKVLSS